MNKRHKLLRRVFSTVMALVLAVSLLPAYAFAASVSTSTTIDGNTTDFTGAWKSAHYKPGTYTVTANLAMPGQYNHILTGVTIRKVPGKTGIDLDNTTIEVIKLNLEPYGYTLDMNYAIVVKTNGEGGPPEYAFEYMLEQYHLIGQVNSSFRSTPFEVLNLLQEEPNGVALLPQPFVEVAKLLVDNLNVPINITQAWNERNLSTGAESVTAVTVVRKAFREQHEQAVQEYLQLAKQSTDYTLANVEQAAVRTDTYETFMNPDIAAQAILHHHRGGDEAEALGLPADYV